MLCLCNNNLKKKRKKKLSLFSLPGTSNKIPIIKKKEEEEMNQ